MINRIVIFVRRFDDIRLPRPRPWIVLVLTLLLTACAAEPVAPAHSQPAPPRTTGPALTIFVTSNGWHSSIVFARADLPPGRAVRPAAFRLRRFPEPAPDDVHS